MVSRPGITREQAQVSKDEIKDNKTGKTHGAHDGRLPLEHVVARGAGAARRWWVTAEVDLARVRQSRKDGAVLPFAHWPEQAASRML